MATVDAPKPGADTDELAQFGYKQELDRSLGSFSSFAAGFSYISILTGVFQLFGLAFLFAGPAFFWSWPIVFIGQMLVALCFAELAGQYPLAGSVYQWSKQTARALTSWMAGWLLLIGSIVTVYVMYGFDTAGSLAEETNNPRKHAPPAIIRALAAAGLAGGLLILVAMMSVSSITAKEIGTLGLPFVVKDVLGDTLGDIFLLDSALAITVCCLAVHTA